MHYQNTLEFAKEADSKDTLKEMTTKFYMTIINEKQFSYKIICEAKVFPSYQYAVESHARLHGFDPDEVIIEVAPREGEYNIRTEDILKTIADNADEVAVVLFGGINYYTGKVFNMKTITEAAHKARAYCGFDLAHAAGNIELHLHDWDVDFACWCSYKYLNSGPGAIGGAFIHEKHHKESLPRFAGWWGYDKPTRFKMEQGFKAMPGAEGWQLSPHGMFLYAAHRAALEIVKEASWDKILSKQKLLTGYLWFLLEEINSSSAKKNIVFITPRNEKERGCQVSMLMLENGKDIYNGLMKEGIFTDWRE